LDNVALQLLKTCCMAFCLRFKVFVVLRFNELFLQVSAC